MTIETSNETTQRSEGYIKTARNNGKKQLVLARKSTRRPGSKKGRRKPLYRERVVYDKVPITFTPQELDEREQERRNSIIRKHQSHQEYQARTNASGYMERKSKIKDMMKHKGEAKAKARS